MNYRKDIYEKVKFMLKDKDGIKLNYAKLGRQYSCDPRTIKKHVEQVENNRQPPKRTFAKKTDGFESVIEEKVKTGAPAIAIFNYLSEEKGYTGSYSTIKSYIHNLHVEKQEKAVARFETRPGQQAQVDWKESLRFRTVDGDVIKFNVFLLTLGYSRVRFLYVTETRDLRQVQECLVKAFEYIGGVPREILFDNMRSIIDKARTQYNEPVFNQGFSQFAADCGFIPRACVAYRPETKGKVEVTAKIMNRLKVYSGDVTCFEDIKRYVAKLNYEINSSISQATDIVPFELLPLEQEHLLKTNLSCLQAYFDKPVLRKVSKESLITYEGKKYSLPPKYIGKYVEIKDMGASFGVVYNGNMVVCWNKSHKKYNFVRSDYIEILKASSIGSRDEIDIMEIAERNMEIYDQL